MIPFDIHVHLRGNCIVRVWSSRVQSDFCISAVVYKCYEFLRCSPIWVSSIQGNVSGRALQPLAS